MSYPLAATCKHKPTYYLVALFVVPCSITHTHLPCTCAPSGTILFLVHICQSFGVHYILLCHPQHVQESWPPLHGHAQKPYGFHYMLSHNFHYMLMSLPATCSCPICRYKCTHIPCPLLHAHVHYLTYNSCGCFYLVISP